LQIKLGDLRPTTVVLGLDEQLGVTVTRPDAAEWKSPRSVESDAALADE
jgi:hypothetical protein